MCQKYYSKSVHATVSAPSHVTRHVNVSCHHIYQSFMPGLRRALSIRCGLSQFCSPSVTHTSPHSSNHFYSKVRKVTPTRAPQPRQLICSANRRQQNMNIPQVANVPAVGAAASIDFNGHAIMLSSLRLLDTGGLRLAFCNWLLQPGVPALLTHQ